MTDDRERKAAEAKFKKSERATEGAKAMADYKAEGEAERAKTVRLKAQRLAKGATDKKEVSDLVAVPDDCGTRRPSQPRFQNNSGRLQGFGHAVVLASSVQKACGAKEHTYEQPLCRE